MAETFDYDFLFCNLCGTMLSLESPQFASCPLCKNKRPAHEIAGRGTCYTITSEEIMRHLNLEPFVVQHGTIPMEEAIVQRATTNEECPKCHNPQLEYYTKQLRSADEGQTIFYECPNCHHKFSLNS